MITRFLALVIITGFMTDTILAQNTLALVNTGNTSSSGSVGSGLAVYEFRIYVYDNDLTSISEDLLREHVFGQLVSRKLYLLESKYTFEVPVVPGNPQTKTVIRKPVIYEAVKKIEHYLKKSVRKGTMSNEAAATTFNKVLDVALNVFAADSGNFEKTIGKCDDLVSLIELFTNRVNLIS